MRVAKREIKRGIWGYAGSVAACVAAAVLMSLTIEGLARRSLTGGFEFLVASPRWFACNLAIILISYLLTLLVKRRVFACVVVSVPWLALGITNCVLLTMRETPLTAVDFVIVTDAVAILPLYLNPLSVALILAAAAAVTALAVFAYRKAPRFAARPVLALCMVALTAGMTAFGVSAGESPLGSGGSTDTNERYSEYGFALSFSCSLFERGIDRPEDYGASDVADALALVPPASSEPEALPDVVFVQLESFFDITRLHGVELSEDPIPAFRKLCAENPSGALTVPVFGGGTANTEFEVLTGMNVAYFGTGEYPYTTLLTDTVCPSVAYDFAAAGLATHALHDHSGSFYGRNEVYANLGFDTFTSIEYMQNVSENPLGWARDECLTDEILTALDSTEGRDFVFAVSVQGHGKYPAEFEDADITAGGEGVGDEDRRAKLEYYVSQLREMDEFVSGLVAALEERGEPVLLVLYGDHLPALGITADELDGSLYETEYVIWSNTGVTADDRALTAYQLAAAVGGMCGLPENELLRLDGAYLAGSVGADEYSRSLEVLMYDALYGEKLAWGGELPWKRTQLVMGTLPVTIRSVRAYTGEPSSGIVVEGDGFTRYSLLVINGVLRRDTVFSDGALYLSGREPTGDFTVEVVQYGDGVVLGASAPVRAHGRAAALTFADN